MGIHWDPLGTSSCRGAFRFSLGPSDYEPRPIELGSRGSREGSSQLVALPDKDSCESFRHHAASRWNYVKLIETCRAICPATPLQRGSHLHKHGSPVPVTLVRCYSPAHIISHHLTSSHRSSILSSLVPCNSHMALGWSFSKPLQNEALTG